MVDGKPLTSPAELARGLRPDQRLLGLDVGTKTLGVALSDGSRVVASPLRTIRRSRFRRDVEALKEIIEAYDVGGVVVGLPVNMDGSEGPRCKSVRQFAANVLATLDVAVAFWDERLSTRAVTRTLIEADLSRRRRAEVIDKVAAAYILQGALDSLRRP
ncbi:MAG: Holliday junction resolvase RuvX [Alphaproteobacteria bacterium]